MRRKVVVAAAALVLAAVAGSMIYRRHSEEATDGGRLRIFGNVDVRDAQLAFEDQERIATVLVEEGERVTQGQVLATLETDRLAAEIAAKEARVAAQEAALRRLENGSRPQEVEAARAGLAAAEASIGNLEGRIARLATTARSGASSEQDLDDARAALDVAQAERRERAATLELALEGPRAEDLVEARAVLEALRAELELLRRRLADGELRAPSPGVIQSRILEPGEMAAPSRPVLTLALTEPKWVRAFVPEPWLGRIANGMRASVRSDSFGGRSYPGWVGFISPVAEFTPKAVETEELRTKLVYEVRVFVEDPRDELRLGMPVTVEVDAAGARGPAPAGDDGARR